VKIENSKEEKLTLIYTSKI